MFYGGTNLCPLAQLPSPTARSQNVTSHRAISFTSQHSDLLPAYIYPKDERVLPRNLQFSEFDYFPHDDDSKCNACHWQTPPPVSSRCCLGVKGNNVCLFWDPHKTHKIKQSFVLRPRFFFPAKSALRRSQMKIIPIGIKRLNYMEINSQRGLNWKWQDVN